MSIRSNPNPLAEAMKMGVACALVFTLPGMLCGGKGELVTVIAAPIAFLLGGVAGYALAIVRARKARVSPPPPAQAGDVHGR